MHFKFYKDIFSQVRFFPVQLLVILFLLSALLSGCQTTSTQTTKYPKQPKLPKQVEVAVMMPLSGEHAQNGKRLSEIIRFGVENSVRGNVNITTYDTADDISLQKSMDEAIKRNTKLILGPLFSNQAMSISQRAAAKDIYVMTLSNNSALANNDHIFVFGHAPIKQTQQLMEYLFQNGYKDIVLLLPSAPHTKNLIKIIESIVDEHRGNIRLIQEYNHTPEDISTALSKVSEVIDSINESDISMTKPLVYLADDPKNLSDIFAGIAKYGIDKKAIICGDNRIDIETNNQINIIFTGSLSHLNNKVSVFAKERFGSEYLNYMDKLAYDLGVLSGFVLGEEFSTDSLLSKLNENTVYKTTSGSLRFTDHIAERKYDVVSRNNGQYKTLYRNTGFSLSVGSGS